MTIEKTSANTGGISFRDAFKGYNKEDVNRYIEDINQELLKSRADSEKEISKRDGLLQKMKDEFDGAGIDGMKQELSRLEAELKKSQLVIMAQNEQLAKSEDEKKTLGEKLRQTDIELEGKKDDGETAEKAKKYDALSARLGSILLEAENYAEDYRRKAISEADRQIEKVNGRIAEYSKQLAQRYETIFSGAQTDLTEALKKMNEKLAAENRKSDEELSGLKNELVQIINSSEETSRETTEAAADVQA